MTTTKSEETTPAELLETFRGSSLKSIVIFTVAVHLIVLLATSGSYLAKRGLDNSKKTDKERMESAVEEMNASMKAIAEKHGLKPQDLSSRLSDGAPKAAKAAPEPTEVPKETPKEVKPSEPEKPKSEIEKEIEKVAPGPDLPNVKDEDLFK